MSTTRTTVVSSDDLDALRVYFPAGSTVYVVVTRPKGASITHRIRVLAMHAGRIERVDYLVARAGIGRYDNRTGEVILRGGGMDMGYDLVDSLSRALYSEGRQLSHVEL